ncbi:flagellar export chaperone FliS [Anaerotignum propionicum]|uniref:Flagellar protein FliS n=1 Tax=Anaerotignum propionicum DSM 1682 TaxID=991789 RepID=A0A0X8VEC4_ANAPI|nr:flagellar export chaperone FliS [Anaerotignum propionicum]AMJ42371.1 flagellar protein FliS [Anaerotignum propionicum DSM 1682]SHF00634.1 flagellar protein FliS [[Clostridium] propionicum DSM 1682] [Anaerotignum propionicum DSM 1682]
MNNYGYQNYKQQSISTMTSGELLTLLFDESAKRLTKAEMAVKAENYPEFEACMNRVSEIIRYLDSTLDKTYSIGQEISKLYEYFQFQIARINAGRNIELIQNLRSMLLDLKNTFKEADRITQAELVKN